ncbi:MAG: hypothetical protein V8S97_02700 [Oscillospiraceae bacterium]
MGCCSPSTPPETQAAIPCPLCVRPWPRRTCPATRSTCLAGPLEQAAYTGTRMAEYDALRRQLSAADAALARVQQAEEYPSFRAGLAAESRLKLRMGLFDGFAARSLERGAAVYESLADVIPRAAFLGGAEVLLSFHLTDALALLFPLAAGLTLLTHERAAGLVNLTRPTRLGRSRVYGRKLMAGAALSTAGFALFYGVNALIAGLLYGFAGLDAPVQSLYGFAACPYRMTVGELLALAAGLKYLWLLCCTALIFLLCARAANAAAAVGCAALCGGIAALMAGSSQLWLRNLSLWQLADGQALCREAVYLNLLGSPSDRVLLGAIFLTALAVIAGIGGAALYAQTPGGSGKWVAFTRSLPRPRHTCLAGHELYKALISRCGLWILWHFLPSSPCCTADSPRSAVNLRCIIGTIPSFYQARPARKRTPTWRRSRHGLTS